MVRKHFFLGSDIFRGSVYGKGHPLNIARVWPVMDICTALGWLDEDHFLSIPPATESELEIFHTTAYIAALKQAEQQGWLETSLMDRHRIGRDSNPLFPQIYSRPATAAKASLVAIDLLVSGKAEIVFNPSGGTHHGMPDRANGFCFVNDPAIAILKALELGVQRLVYIDIDAHHADGVQDHLSNRKEVLLFSLHEQNRWPYTGKDNDIGGGSARNFTLARGADDNTLLQICQHKILPEIQQFNPELVIVQAGCDGLADDPQSGLCYSNSGYWKAVKIFLDYAKPILVLGGGGYNPFTTARAWAGLWGLIAGKNPEQTVLNPQASAIMRSLQWEHRRGRNPPESWFTHLGDGNS